MLTTYNEIDMTSIMQMRDLYKGTFVFKRTSEKNLTIFVWCDFNNSTKSHQCSKG